MKFLLFCRVFFGALALFGAISLPIIQLSAQSVNPDGPLRIEITTAYNFIVDSNVETPATYAPRAAYISARIWNDGSTDLTNVVANIGDHIENTPGIYPSRVHTENTSLLGPLMGGAFSLTHEGGTMGAIDATRTIPSIPAGEYIPVYWLVSYPNLDENGVTVTGGIKPADDLYLFYDIWVQAQDGATTYDADVRRKATMRNCISAMANKIFPNTANKVPDEYQNLIEKYAPEWNNIQNDGTAGTSVVTEGIWYDLGNVGQGFDNNGDLVPDQNAWLQPVGDPSIFDPSAFRLSETYALIIVKLKSGGELVLDVKDQLYFSDLPDNTGVIGLVRYDFLPLKANATSTLTPYQMAASGFDNEKFNGDYGASVGTLTSPATDITLDKTVDQANASAGDPLTYTVNFTNPGVEPVGDPSLGIPVVVQDSIPANTTYTGSAATGNTLPAGVSAYEVRYSTDGGATWSTTQPGVAADVTDLQWWLSDPLPAGASGTVTFSVSINDPIPGVVLIENTAGLSFGNTTPFLFDDAVTLITGVNSISGTVFEDDGGSGAAEDVFGNGIQDSTEEAGIDLVTVTLYYDTNNNDAVDSGDFLVATYVSDTDVDPALNGDYLFSNLPAGEYVVQVDSQTISNGGAIPSGFTNTNSTQIAVTLGPDSSGNDFGFAPTLQVVKTAGEVSVKEGDAVTYTIEVTNQYPVGGFNEFIQENPTTATTSTVDNKAWLNPSFATGVPDGQAATADLSDAAEILTLSGFPAIPSGLNVSRVELVIECRAEELTDDDEDFEVTITGATPPTGSPLIIPVADLPAGANFEQYIIDISSWKPTLADWAATDFTAVVIDFVGQKRGSAPTGVNPRVLVDSIHFHVVYTQDTTLSLVPLTDTYNADELTFDSATPGETTSNVSGPTGSQIGTLTWANIGPIAPGNTSTVTLNFTANNLPDNQELTTVDHASVTGAEFSNGDPANDGSDSAETPITPTGAIGDTIFFDVNQNGLQDAGEPGIENALVELYLDNVFVTSLTTDADGKYLFTGLAAGNYEVRVDGTTGPLVGATLTADPDNDGLPCSDPLATGCDGIDAFSLLQGQTYVGADFGYFLPGGVIDGTLWIDFDNDGVIDDGEIPVPYVTITLYDGVTPIATTVTDENGYYSFGALTNGDYRVEVDTVDEDFPADSVHTYDFEGDLDNQSDATINIPSVSSATRNFGYRYAGDNSLSGTIGMDDPANIDGVMGSGDSGVDPDEAAFAGVTVYAYLWTDTNTDDIVDAGEAVLLGSTTTDVNGDYAFTNLPEGILDDRYIVSMVPPIGNLSLTTTTTVTPADTLVESNNTQGHTTGAYQSVPVAQTITGMDFAFESVVEMDFGDLPATYSGITLLPGGARHIIPNPLSPTLYLGTDVDTEANGQVAPDADADNFDDGVMVTGVWQNGTNGGSLDVVVVGSGWLVGYIDFDNDGNFLGSGDLVVYQQVTTGSYSYQFDVPGVSLDTDGSTYFYARFRLLPDEPFLPELAYSGEVSNGEVEDYRLGFHAVSGIVYADADTNSLFSGGDVVQAGVEVGLYLDNVLIATTVTQEDGSYSFYGLPADDYEIRSTTPASSSALLDVDGSGNGDDIIAISIVDASLTEQNFLVGTPSSLAGISGTVYRDADTNSSFSGGDVPQSGVVVTLYRDINNVGIADANEFVAATTTLGDGSYAFTDLPDGNYIITSVAPQGSSSILDVDGATNGDDLIQTTLSGTDVINQDFLVDGNVVLADISGTYFIDADEDLVFSGGDTVLDGVTISLYRDTNGNGLADPGEFIESTTTNLSGAYNFTDLPSGDYIVTASTPAGAVAVTDIDGGANTTTLIETTLAGTGTDVTGQDFLGGLPGSISGTILIDTDNDTIGDQPHEGVTVALLDGSGNPVLDGNNDPITTVTDVNGDYSFAGLNSGNYQVRQTVPTGYTAIDDVDAGDFTVIGDQTLISVALGEDVIDQDFVNTQFGAVVGPEFCLALDGSVNGDFLRPTGLPANVTYFLEYTSALGDPTTWAGSVELDGTNTSVVDNLDGTETVTITDIPTLTGLTSGSGFVRLRIDLDADEDTITDETQYSAVSGWVDSAFGLECRSYNNPFLSCPPLRATVVSIAGSVLTLDADAEVLTPGLVDYYVEVIDGFYEGQRFDVASVSGSTLTLTSSSDLCAVAAPYNTMIGAPTSAIDGSQIVLRVHKTLDTLFPVGGFNATTDPMTADQVTLFDGTGNVCYWLNGTGSPRWVLTGDATLADQGSVIVPPGHGVWVNSTTVKTLTSYGQVRENDFVRPLCQGFNAVAGGYPITQSAVGREYSLANGFVGNADYVKADQFLIWNGDNIAGRLGYQTHYLSSYYTPERWIKAADVFRVDVKTQLLFIRDRAAFLDLQQDNLTYGNQAPWSLQP